MTIIFRLPLAIIIVVLMSGCTKIDQETGKIDQKQERIRNSINFDYFGGPSPMDLKIINPTQRRIKDFTITCKGFGASGTQIGEKTFTLFEAVQPGDTVYTRAES